MPNSSGAMLGKFVNKLLGKIRRSRVGVRKKSNRAAS